MRERGFYPGDRRGREQDAQNVRRRARGRQERDLWRIYNFGHSWISHIILPKLITTKNYSMYGTESRNCLF